MEPPDLSATLNANPPRQRAYTGSPTYLICLNNQGKKAKRRVRGFLGREVEFSGEGNVTAGRVSRAKGEMMATLLYSNSTLIALALL